MYHPCVLTGSTKPLKIKNFTFFQALRQTLAEREGFEPPIRLPVRRISSAVLSTTQPPLQVIDMTYILLDWVNAPNAIATEIATESSSFGL